MSRLYIADLGEHTVADKQTQPIWRAPSPEFSGKHRRSVRPADSENRTFNAFCNDLYEPIFKISTFCDFGPKIWPALTKSINSQKKYRNAPLNE